MSTVELLDEIKHLKETNNELAQKVQYWKVTAAQRENEKLNLMKEINELRLKLSRLQNNGNIKANNLDAAIQSASEKAIAHLVKASSEIAKTLNLTKSYMRERQELEAVSPRWSAIGGTPSSAKKDKVHRVPPMMIGGQSIQPVVALTMLNMNETRSAVRSPNTNRSVTERALPMLQDVYIPLTRIDAGRQSQSLEADNSPSEDDNSDHLELDDSEQRDGEEPQQMSDIEECESEMLRLDAVTEDTEPVAEAVSTPRNRSDNPLEGPSWMLNVTTDSQSGAARARVTLEPDSTTELEDSARLSPPQDTATVAVAVPSDPLSQFSPTVRRRKRCSSPHLPASPCLPAPPRRTAGRVLKVVVSKLRLEQSPARRAQPVLDAPSPNGATVAGLIVSETNQDIHSGAAEEPAPRRARLDSARVSGEVSIDPDGAAAAPLDNTVKTERDSRDCTVKTEPDSRDSSLEPQGEGSRPASRVRRARADSRESESSTEREGRTRRARKNVTYKEKPLNRKMRR